MTISQPYQDPHGRAYPWAITIRDGDHVTTLHYHTQQEATTSHNILTRTAAPTRRKILDLIANQ